MVNYLFVFVIQHSSDIQKNYLKNKILKHENTFSPLVVNDQNRIVKVVNENRNTFSTKVRNDTIPEQQRFMNSTKYDHVRSTQEQMTVPVIARAANSSFITTGGIVGIRSPQNAQQEGRLLPSNDSTTHDGSVTEYAMNGPQLPTNAKASSLVSATMKISSATTELYQKGGDTTNVDTKEVYRDFKGNENIDGPRNDERDIQSHQYQSHDHQMRVKLPPPKTSNVSTLPCANTHCGFYGTAELDYFCSKCYNLNVQKRRELEPVKSSASSHPEEIHTNNSAVLPELTRQQHSISNKLAQGR